MAALEPEVSLVVGGRKHEGWQAVTVHQSIEEVAPTFSLDYTQRWSPDGSPLPINVGDAVEVRFGDLLVLTGYVDDVTEDYEAGSHTVGCSGRSRTGDLVDCAAIYKNGSIAGKNLFEIAGLLCEPFGITVLLSEPVIDIDDPIGQPIKQFQIQDGASVVESINELARKEGVLLGADAKGNLVLSRAATVPTPGLELRTGDNIKRGSLRASMRDRFSSYLLKGQVAGTDLLSGATATQIKTSLTDADVKRYRPLTLVDHQTTLAQLRQRALWERNTRAGKASALTYDVRGWTHATGLWAVNTLVHVVDSRFGIDTTLLVSAVDFQRTLNEGRMTRLELVDRATFDVLKPPKPHRRKGKRDALSGLL